LSLVLWHIRDYYRLIVGDEMICTAVPTSKFKKLFRPENEE